MNRFLCHETKNHEDHVVVSLGLFLENESPILAPMARTLFGWFHVVDVFGSCDVRLVPPVDDNKDVERVLCLS